MDKEKDLANALNELRDKLNGIEEQLNNQVQDPSAPVTIHLHVREVTIQQLKLDELAYHLGSIDIKDLSGMLNLGNTFSPSANPKQKKEKAPVTDTAAPGKKQNNDEIQIIINGRKVHPIEQRK